MDSGEGAVQQAVVAFIIVYDSGWLRRFLVAGILSLGE